MTDKSKNRERFDHARKAKGFKTPNDVYEYAINTTDGVNDQIDFAILEALTIFGDNDSTVNMAIAVIYQKCADHADTSPKQALRFFDNACEYYRKSLQADPTNKFCIKRYREMLTRELSDLKGENQWTEKLTRENQLLECYAYIFKNDQADTDPMIFFSMAAISWELGKGDLALAAIAQAHAKKPNDSSISKFKRKIEEETGEKASVEAWDYLAQELADMIAPPAETSEQTAENEQHNTND